MGWLNKELELRINKVVDSYIARGIPIVNIGRYFKRNLNILIDDIKDIKHKYKNEEEFKDSVKTILDVVIKDRIYEEKDK